ncbi:uncharacterized protein METZ01_LOCUS150998, partial [marine metagenome]
MKLRGGLMGIQEKIRVLVVGDIIVDKYVFGKTDRISPEAAVPVLDIERAESRLGGAANVAFNLKKLDSYCDVSLLGIVGDDRDGGWLRTYAQSVDISPFFIKKESITTNTKTRFISDSHLLRVDNSPSGDLYNITDQIDLAFNNIKWDMVIIADYDFGVLYKQSIEHILSLAKCPVIVDPKFKNFWNYDGVFCIKPNRKEIIAALYNKIGRNIIDSYDIDSSLISLVEEMAKYNESDHIVVTSGDQGILWYDKIKTSH